MTPFTPRIKLSYPDTIDTFRSLQNRVGVIYDALKVSRIYAKDMNDLNAAVVAIEIALGINPKGTAASVAARIAAIESLVPSAPFIIANNEVCNFAKSTTIEQFYKLATDPANIKALWFFDQTGAAATIPDRSPNNHVLDLSANANTLTPVVQGLARGLTINGPTSFYDTTDSDDFSPAGPTKFTIIWAGKLVDASSSTLLSKFDFTTGANKLEFRFFTFTDDHIYAQIYTDAANYIGRQCTDPLTADENSFHVYAMTYSGGTTSASVKIYRDGVQIDNANTTAGTFTNIPNTTAKPASYYIASNGTTKAYPLKGKPSCLSFIKSEEWPATQIKRISTLLLGWGNNLV